MRNNKFRGMQIGTDDFVYGYYFQNLGGHFILCGTFNGMPNMIEVYGNTVGQFTGLPDRNDKNICEGDIVEGEKYSGKPGIYNNHTGVVKFRHESFSSFGINQYKGQEAKINSLFEIIGNIYDNPELLEVVK